MESLRISMTFISEFLPEDLFVHSAQSLLVYPEIETMSLSQKGGLIGYISIELFSQVQMFMLQNFCHN